MPTGLMFTLLAQKPLREDRPEDAARLAAVVEIREKVEAVLAHISEEESSLRFALLPEDEQEQFAQMLADYNSGVPVGLAGEDEPVTPCPAWCNELLHAESQTGRVSEHGVSVDLTPRIGCRLFATESGEPLVYVADADCSIKEARQLAAALLSAVEAAETGQPIHA